MSLIKSVGVHAVLAALAGTTALALWTKDEEPVKAAAAEVRVWAGTPDQLQSAYFESEEIKVRLEPKKDELGRWYVVHVNELQKKPDASANPHAPPKEEPKDVGKWVKSKFVSVKEGNTLVEALAPLYALRAVGRVGKAREEEFGFDEPEGNLAIKLNGKEHKLTVGGVTPGGGDRYVRLADSHEAYAILGEALRGFLHPQSRLLETQLHGFEMEDVQRLKVSLGNQSRQLLRVAGKASGWASLEAPSEQDETASNWMTKVARLRVKEYVENQPKQLTQDAQVVHVEYFDAKKTIGFLELYKLRGQGEEASDRYLVRTEHTRWYAEVLQSLAEQVERDLASVLSGQKEAAK